MNTKGIVILNKPMQVKRYDYLYEHFDCDSIIENRSDLDDSYIVVVGYSLGKQYNKNLRTYYIANNMKGNYLILRGLGSQEVNSID